MAGGSGAVSQRVGGGASVDEGLSHFLRRILPQAIERSLPKLVRGTAKRWSSGRPWVTGGEAGFGGAGARGGVTGGIRRVKGRCVSMSRVRKSEHAAVPIETADEKGYLREGFPAARRPIGEIRMMAEPSALSRAKRRAGPNPPRSGSPSWCRWRGSSLPHSISPTAHRPGGRASSPPAARRSTSSSLPACSSACWCRCC